MDIENRVATLEQSKRLKELGGNFEGCFWWHDYGKKGSVDYLIEINLPKLCRLNIGTYPAPTAEEIAELLPGSIITCGFKYFLLFVKKEDEYLFTYKTDRGCNEFYLCQHVNKSLTQALASMLIWLIENNHINPKEMNGK